MMDRQITDDKILIVRRVPNQMSPFSSILIKVPEYILRHYHASGQLVFVMVGVNE